MDNGRFYDATQGSPALPSLLKALTCWEAAPGLAVDLGCGAGRDSLELLRRGWRVLAIDQEPAAIERLRAQVPPEQLSVLETLCARFEDAALPAANLINSSFALPFCAPADFPALWRRIEQALQTGGLFAGHFFGERDDWATQGLTIHSSAQVETLLHGWQVIALEEIDRRGKTAVGREKHWHLFSVVARRGNLPNA